MRKVIIVIAVLGVGILTIIGYYYIQAKKYGEPSKVLVSKPVSTHHKMSTRDEKNEMSEVCRELWKKTPNFTQKEQKILRDVCRIPWAHSTSEMVSVIKWWKDEDGHEDMLEMCFSHLTQEPDPWVNLHAIWGPLRNLALNSKFPRIRERSIVALYEIDKLKSIPVLKEALRKEVEERGVERANRWSAIYQVEWILSKEGEYEYAFPYLMKAKMFREALKKNDRGAIPFLKEALSDKDEEIRVDAAIGLIQFGEEKEKTFRVLTTFLNETNTKVNQYGAYGAYRGFAIKGLGDLKDKRAIPVLEKAYKYDYEINKEEITAAINEITRDAK